MRASEIHRICLMRGDRHVLSGTRQLRTWWWCSTFTDTTHRDDTLINMSQPPAQILVITAVLGRLEARRNHHEAVHTAATQWTRPHKDTPIAEQYI